MLVIYCFLKPPTLDAVKGAASGQRAFGLPLGDSEDLVENGIKLGIGLGVQDSVDNESGSKYEGPLSQSAEVLAKQIMLAKTVVDGANMWKEDSGVDFVRYLSEEPKAHAVDGDADLWVPEGIKPSILEKSNLKTEKVTICEKVSSNTNDEINESDSLSLHNIGLEMTGKDTVISGINDVPEGETGTKTLASLQNEVDADSTTSKSNVAPISTDATEVSTTYSRTSSLRRKNLISKSVGKDDMMKMSEMDRHKKEAENHVVEDLSFDFTFG